MGTTIWRRLGRDNCRRRYTWFRVCSKRRRYSHRHAIRRDRDTKGDLYEPLLSKIATAGQNGQFCTSRHIIDLMVKLVAIRLASIWMSQISGAFRLLVGFAHLWTFGQGALFGFTRSYTGIHRLGGAAPLLTASLRPDAPGRKTRTYEYGASVG